MEVVSKFKVVARCDVFSSGVNENNIATKNRAKSDFSLLLDSAKAKNFIFRNGEKHFMVGKYKVSILEYEGKTVIQMVSDEDDLKLIVRNSEQFLNDVLAGYTRLVALEKINSMFEFDFETAIEAQNLQFVEEEI